MGQGDTSESIEMALPAAEESASVERAEPSFPGGRSGRSREKSPLSIAFIDPKPLTRRAIMEMLANAFPDNVTIAASSCEELFETQRRAGGYLQAVIVYIRSAGVTDRWVQDGLQLVRLRYPDTPVIMLSDRDDAEEVVKALTFGVRGYIPTSIDCEVAFAALSLIYAGGTYVPAHVWGSVADFDRMTEEQPDQNQRSSELDLTDRELGVIHLLREGKSNKLIAAQLKMQESTVKVHVRNILKKLHVSNRTQAASIANRELGPKAPTAGG